MHEDFDLISMKRDSTTRGPQMRAAAGAFVLKGVSIVRVQVLPRANSVSKAVGGEVSKILKRPGHAKVAGKALASNGIGLLMGMLSAQLVSRYFEVRSIHNLWGLFSRETLVSANTYNVLCFGLEFIVALVVFTLTDHFIDEVRSRRERRSSIAADASRTH